MSNLMRYLLFAMTLLLVASCAQLKQNSLKGPGWYLVKPTDTLYSIAWRYDLDYRTLAEWNGLSDPYTVHPGQQLVLIKPDNIPPPVQQKVPESSQKSTHVVVKSLTPDYNRVIRWRWPTEGTVEKGFSINDLDSHGIDIAGAIGQPVYAVAEGKVVYSGNGLADYGNLIIVKHNETFLSAYAFTRKRLVDEGVVVKRGAKIAEMGRGRNNSAILHFQIRKDGKPVDPELYLPKP